MSDLLHFGSNKTVALKIAHEDLARIGDKQYRHGPILYHQIARGLRDFDLVGWKDCGRLSETRNDAAGGGGYTKIGATMVFAQCRLLIRKNVCDGFLPGYASSLCFFQDEKVGILALGTKKSK